MSLSTEQKAFILKCLNSQLHSVDLKCDGYTVRLYLQRVQDLKLATEVFVDGWVKGEWLTNPDKHPESKFFPYRYKHFYSPSKKKIILKRWGKRRAYELFPDLDKKLEYRGTHFSSGRAALNHLIKVSDSIELLTKEPAIAITLREVL